MKRYFNNPYTRGLFLSGVPDYNLDPPDDKVDDPKDCQYCGEFVDSKDLNKTDDGDLICDYCWNNCRCTYCENHMPPDMLKYHNNGDITCEDCNDDVYG